MEFCSRGTLFDVLKNEKDPIDWKLAHKLATDTVRGIWCLHSWKPQVIHNDQSFFFEKTCCLEHFYYRLYTEI